MANGYCCVCCALPKNLIRHLANRSSGAKRELLEAQIAHASALRGQRAAHSKVPPPAEVGRMPLHRQVFDAQGTAFVPGVLLRDEDDPPVRDKHANQAYENVGIALQFYKKVLGRDSIDGHGLRVDTSVHYRDRFANAAWDGRQMVVGVGDGEFVSGLAH